MRNALNHCRSLSLVLALVVCACPSSGQAQTDDALRESALQSIDHALEMLRGEQKRDGSWEVQGHTVGATSLVLISLFHAGLTDEDPAVARGLRYLRLTPPPDGIYDCSLMLMALSMAHDSQDAGRIHQLTQYLIEAQHKPGDGGPGAWGYDAGSRSRWDNSVSQFALLGLREAARYGETIPREVWKLAQDHWLKTRQGSLESRAGCYWYYFPEDRRPRGSMVVAAISSLSITDSMLEDDVDVDAGGRINCCGAIEDDEVHRTIEAAFRWLGAKGNFTVSANPAVGDLWHLYYLYGLERAGRFTGRRFIGEHDWYRLGVRRLVAIQNSVTGAWFDTQTASAPLVGTAFGLLFVSKGNSPVLVNKLKYGDPDNDLFGRGWNRHPRDIANLTEYVSTQPRWPKLLNWQVTDLGVAASQDDKASLLQAKVQYLSGDGPLDTISDAEVELLREYINQGGFLFAVNTCGGAEFDRGIRQLVARMFPEGQFTLEKLPPTHDIYRSEHVFTEAEGVSVPELWGVDIGCRTAVVYSPEDHACRWKKWMCSDPPRRQLQVKTQIAHSMRLAVNVIAYATGRELLDALTEPERLARLDENTPRRGRLEIARLRHSGGWDTAPNALRHLQSALQTVGVAAYADSPNLPATDPQLPDFPLVYMHGRRNFRLTEAEQTALRRYLDHGGVLIADASCGSAQFDESFRQLIQQLFDRPLEAVALDDPLLNHPLAHDIRQVKRRLPLESRPTAPLASDFTVGPPILETIRDEAGRLQVIYSKYDLSCALERQATVNCAGYASADAARIATNIVVTALTQ